MKKILFIALLVMAMLGTTAFASNYSDMVSQDHWSYEALEYAMDAGLINGFTDGTLRPEAPLTRAQMAAIMVRQYGDGTTKGDLSEFIDLNANEWYYPYVEEAVGLGFFKGNGDGHFNPDSDLTRQESFVVVCRVLGLEEISGATDFADDASIDDWAKGSIKALKAAGYISGDDAGRINATGVTSREEFAQLSFNVHKKTEAGKQDEEKDENKETDEKENSGSSSGGLISGGSSGGSFGGGGTSSGGSSGGGSVGGDNTGDDNTGDDNTGGDNTGGDNTGDDNTGGDNTGDDNTGDNPEVDEQNGMSVIIGKDNAPYTPNY